LLKLPMLPMLLLAGCIVVPRSTEVYDPQCRTMVRQMVLETAVIGTLGHCSNEGCATLLAALGVVGAASAVVSGSVAVIGNMVYWAERQGRCPAVSADPPAPPRLPQPLTEGATAAPQAASGPQRAGEPLRPAPAPTPRPLIVPGIVPLPAAPGASSPS
jgi:hypothetical protein